MSEKGVEPVSVETFVVVAELDIRNPGRPIRIVTLNMFAEGRNDSLIGTFDGTIGARVIR